MLSFRYVPLLNHSVSIFLSVQVSGWSFSSGIVSESGALGWTKMSGLNSRKNSSVEWKSISREV